MQLPSYVQDVSTDATHSNAPSWQLLDPRALDAPDFGQRGIGLWQSSAASFDVTIEANQSQSFNLSVYTASADMGYSSGPPPQATYNEQFGRDIVITVSDAVTTQSVRLYNNAPGVWVTFPVTANPSTPVTITVSTGGTAINSPVISALAFDAYDNRQTTMTYNGTNDLAGVTDPLGGVISMTYNSNGTTASVTDPLLHQTVFGYDGYGNVNAIQDATLATTHLTYDANGNVLTMEDPLGPTHTWHYVYEVLMATVCRRCST